MKAELNFYKKSGKWYTKEIIEYRDIEVVEKQASIFYPDMNFTIHIVESDGFLQPYRLFLT
jgi:hypothetical protein